MKAVSTAIVFCMLWLCAFSKELNGENLEQSVRASLKSQMTAKHRILLNLSPEKKSQLNDIIHQAVQEALEQHPDQAAHIDPVQLEQQLEAELGVEVSEPSTTVVQPTEEVSTTTTTTTTTTSTSAPTSLSEDELAAIKQQFEDQVNAYEASLTNASPPQSTMSAEQRAALKAKVAAKFEELEKNPEFTQKLMEWLQAMDITSVSSLSEEQKEVIKSHVLATLKEKEQDPDFQQQLLLWLGSPLATPAPSTSTSLMGMTAIPSEQKTEQDVEIAYNVEDDATDDGDNDDSSATKHIVINFSTESLINLWAIVGVILLVNVILYCCYCKNKEGQAFVPNDDVLQESV